MSQSVTIYCDINCTTLFCHDNYSYTYDIKPCYKYTLKILFYIFFRLQFKASQSNPIKAGKGGMNLDQLFLIVIVGSSPFSLII